MRTIGLIGGVSWLTTERYYRAINEGVSAVVGGYASAPLTLWSLDFAEVQRLQRSGDVDGELALLVDAARSLERAGAGCVLIANNTMNRLAPAVQEAVTIPVLGIVDAVGQALTSARARRCALAGARLALEPGLFPERLGERFGIDVVVPDEPGRAVLQGVIEREYAAAVPSAEAAAQVRSVLAPLVASSVDALVLACTCLPKLVDRGSLPVPVYDTAALHAQAAVDWCLGGGA
jgi:aspartate racemase